jgi:hypothetical protein
MNLIDILVVITFGWPAIIATAVLAGIGLIRSNHRFLVAAAVLSVPFTWFLSGFPIIRSPVFILPVLLLASAFAMYRDRQMIAWLLAIPFYLSILLLLLAVWSQPV